MKPAHAWLLIVAVASSLLVALAWRFDFFCDDAFITLRYARNLAHGLGPVYNAGEHVEGYTSFVWMVLSALPIALGLPAEASVQGLGALSGVLLIAATAQLFRWLEPEQTAFGAVAVFALAVSAPVDAWTMGGLETPLFAALVTWSIVLGSDLVRDPTKRAGARSG